MILIKGIMDPLISLASKKVINLKVAAECLEKLIEASVVYVPVQLIPSATRRYTNKKLEVYFLGAVYSNKEKALEKIPKHLKPEEFQILKYHLNPSFPIDMIYLFETDTLPLVTNDSEYFQEMYSFYSKCVTCRFNDGIKEEKLLTLCSYEVDKGSLYALE